VKKGKLSHAFEQILVVIIFILAIFLLEFFVERNLRLVVIALLSFLYIVIGVWHHYEEKNLKISQILEHSAIGAIIFIILATYYLR